MPSFRAKRGNVRVVFDEPEAELLRQLLGELREILGSEDRADTVVGRLFPPAYEGAADEAEYRDLADDSLRREKQLGVERVSQAVGDDGGATVTIGRDELDAWLPVLTDMRLAIGMRLDVDEARMSRPVEASEPDAFPLSVLHWLGWITEELIRGVR